MRPRSRRQSVSCGLSRGSSEQGIAVQPTLQRQPTTAQIDRDIRTLEQQSSQLELEIGHLEQALHARLQRKGDRLRRVQTKVANAVRFQKAVGAAAVWRGVRGTDWEPVAAAGAHQQGFNITSTLLHQHFNNTPA